MIQHSQPVTAQHSCWGKRTSRLGPNPGLAAGLWAANRRLRPFPWMQCLSSNCFAEALAEGLDVHDVRRFVALRLSAVSSESYNICISNNK